MCKRREFDGTMGTEMCQPAAVRPFASQPGHVKLEGETADRTAGEGDAAR